MERPRRLKIAILDDFQNAGAPFFDKFKASGHEITSFTDTGPPSDDRQSAKAALKQRLEPYHVLVTTRERTPLPEALLKALPNLRLILTNGQRNASIDLQACRDLGIEVLTSVHHPLSNSRAVDSTSEHTIALIMALARDITRDDASIKTSGWQSERFPVTLGGKTVGVVGLGRLGRTVARILHAAFGMNVIAWSQNLTQDKADEQAVQAGLPVEADGKKVFRAVSKEELFRESDFVTVHLVLSERTRGAIGRADLDRMKPGAFFINTARGPLVVEQDLLAVLKEGKIRGAALDVFDTEPLEWFSEWRSTFWGKDGSSHVLVTPHTGFVNSETITGWYEDQARLLEDWLAGRELRNSLVSMTLGDEKGGAK